MDEQPAKKQNANNNSSSNQNGIGYNLHQGLRPMCLEAPFFGQTSNRIITIGKLLRLVHQEGEHRAIGLDLAWSMWYQMHFDPRSDVILFYVPSGECEKVYDGREAFYSSDWELSYLVNFVPKAKYRTEAEEMLHSWSHGSNFISVHRRDLDGSCNLFAECAKFRKNKCVRKRDTSLKCSISLRLQACNMEYGMIPNPRKMSIVLFTDGQVPKKDATFPHIFNNSSNVLVDMWIMANSRVHWGNPRSSLDIVVASWRQGHGMEPRTCYDPTHILFQP